MLELKLLLFAQGVRFLVFDYKLFRALREYLDKFSFFQSLFKCPFCQGFWCGLFAFGFSFGLIDAFMWGLGSGIISITWYAVVIPRLDELEGVNMADKSSDD